MDRNTQAQAPIDTLFQEWFDTQQRLEGSGDWTEEQHDKLCDRVHQLETRIAASPSDSVRACMIKVAVTYRDVNATSQQVAVADEAWRALNYERPAWAQA